MMMRKTPPVLTALFLASGLPLWAAPMQKAEVTRTFNEVRILPAAGDSRDAKAGDVIDGKTAVRTGDKSRAELKFTDETLTRLGANSQFSFETGTRNLSLDNGVIFLQVPKGAGGAKIKTAAVTAAVTGTTIMVEHVQGKVLKYIVIEGKLDVFDPEHPSNFITLKPGQLLMMKPGAQGGFPRPVEVDVKRLLATSDLAGGEKEGVFQPMGGAAGKAIKGTVDKQKQELEDGELIPTNIVLPGRGNQALLLPADAAFALRAGAPLVVEPPPPDAPETSRPRPVDRRFLPPPTAGGEWRINESMMLFLKNPSITQGGLAASGSIYQPNSSGPLHAWLFGTVDTVPGDRLAEFMSGTSPWSAYLLSSVVPEGTPVLAQNGPNNLLFASPTSISIQNASPGASLFWSLDGLHNWGLFTQGGDINLLNPDFFISGSSANLVLHANGPGSNILLGNTFSLGDGGLFTFSGGDTQFQYSPLLPILGAQADTLINQASLLSDISGSKLMSTAGGRVDVDDADIRMSESIDLQAGTGIRITNGTLYAGNNQITVNAVDSNTLAALVDGAGAGGRVNITTNTGDIQINGETLIEATGNGSRVDIVATSGAVDLNSQPALLPGSISAEDTVRVVSLGGANPRVSIFGFTLSANNIEVQANGSNAFVDISNSSFLAGQSARLYAEGPGSLLQFSGSNTLTGSEVRLAGETVRVQALGVVNALNVGRLGIHANNHAYYLSGETPNAFGVIIPGATTEVIRTNYAGRNSPLP